MLRSYIDSSPRKNSLINTNRSLIPIALRRSLIGVSFNTSTNSVLPFLNRSLNDSAGHPNPCFLVWWKKLEFQPSDQKPCPAGHFPVQLKRIPYLPNCFLYFLDRRLLNRFREHIFHKQKYNLHHGRHND